MLTDFKNKIAIITGAANGLGKALAIEFYKQGCHLALVDIDLSGLEKTRSELETGGQPISIHQADIANEKNIFDVRLEILHIHKQVDILVNNAAVSISQYFCDMEMPDYKRLFDINFWGVVYCTKYFLPDLTKQADSRIVNIISDFALMGFTGKTAYSSSKSAVMGFTNSLKTELAGTNVKICLVVPPPLATGLIKNSKHINENKKVKEEKFLVINGLRLDKTAEKIVNEVRAGKYRIIIGTLIYWIDLFSRLFPGLIHKLIGSNRKRIDFV